MLGRLLLLLVLLPVIEIVLLVWIAMQTSVLLVLGLLVAAAVLGSVLARQQGLRAITRVADEVRAGRMPAAAMFDALLVGLAAVLLILPGFISDVAAILLLVPATRSAIKTLLRRGLQARVTTVRYTGFETAGRRDEIIDVQVIDSPPPRVEG